MKTIIWILLAGCAGAREGRPFNAVMAAELSKRKPTPAEIIAAIGQPFTAAPEVGDCKFTGKPIAEMWNYRYSDKENDCFAAFIFERDGAICHADAATLKPGPLCAGGQP